MGSTDATLTCDGVAADDFVDFDICVSNSNACLTDDDILGEIFDTEDAGSDDVIEIGYTDADEPLKCPNRVAVMAALDTFSKYGIFSDDGSIHNSVVILSTKIETDD